MEVTSFIPANINMHRTEKQIRDFHLAPAAVDLTVKGNVFMVHATVINMQKGDIRSYTTFAP